MSYDENYSDAANEADQDLLDQLNEDLMRLAELADAEADRLDAELSTELDAHIQHPAIPVNEKLLEETHIEDCQ